MQPKQIVSEVSGVKIGLGLREMIEEKQNSGYEQTAFFRDMKSGDRVRVVFPSKYAGKVGTILRYDPAWDQFLVSIDDDRPFEIEMASEYLEHYDIQHFEPGEFDSIFD